MYCAALWGVLLYLLYAPPLSEVFGSGSTARQAPAHIEPSGAWRRSGTKLARICLTLLIVAGGLLLLFHHAGCPIDELVGVAAMAILGAGGILGAILFGVGVMKGETGGDSSGTQWGICVVTALGICIGGACIAFLAALGSAYRH
jgi:hypothetical protein